MGLSNQIIIPYFKIFGTDGETLKKYLESQKTPPSVYLKVDMSLANPDNRVEYELWYSSILDLNAESIKQLGEYQKPFGADALFTPRILTFDCENCPKSVREANCLSDGRYCPYRPRSHKDEYSYQGSFFHDVLDSTDSQIHNVASKVGDLDMLFESLRERCLYEKVLHDDKSSVLLLWYQYMYNMLILSI